MRLKNHELQGSAGMRKDEDEPQMNAYQRESEKLFGTLILTDLH
jgi:hypothetical protein